MDKVNLQELVDIVAKQQYGITKTDALKEGICVRCKKPIDGRIKTEAGAREYQNSALCEICYDGMFQ